MSPALLIVIIAIAVLIWVGLRYGSTRATPVRPDDPLWRAAIERARATVPVLRELHDAGREVWVKFALKSNSTDPEHVWGRVSGVDRDTLRCTLETPPVSAPAGSYAQEFSVSMNDLEDWQVQLDDGSIRGGFTTRAQAQIAERDGSRVPKHIRDMITRMVD